MCSTVSKDIRPQAITLANAVLAMQDKIEQQVPIYKDAALAQKVTVGTGEQILRQNPVVQEFRATVRDYAQALNNLQDIIEENKIEERATSLDGFRQKLKVVSE